MTTTTHMTHTLGDQTVRAELTVHGMDEPLQSRTVTLGVPGQAKFIVEFSYDNTPARNTVISVEAGGFPPVPDERQMLGEFLVHAGEALIKGAAL